MSKFCKDGIIVNAQEYKKYRNVWRGVGRGISERLFGDYKALMGQLRLADDELRQTALGKSGKIDISIKEAIQRADTALKENRLIDSLYYVGLIDVITREVIAKALPTVEVLQTELYKQYSETNESEALTTLEEQSKNAQETFNTIAKYSVEINKNAQFLQNIYRGLMGGDPMQRAWAQEVRKFRQPVEKAVNSGYRFVDRLISIFDRLGIARASGKIGDWVAGINEIVKIQPMLNKEVLAAYQRIQPIIEAAKQDQAIAAEQSKESKPVGLDTVIQDVASNIIEKVEPKRAPVDIPDLEVEGPSVTNEEIDNSQIAPEVSKKVVEPVVEPIVEPVAEPIVEPVAEPITPIEPVVEPVVEKVIEPAVTEDPVEKAVEKVKKQRKTKQKEKVAPEIISKPEEPVVEVPKVNEEISEPKLPEVIEQPLTPVVEPAVETKIDEPVVEPLVEETKIEEPLVEETTIPEVEVPEEVPATKESPELTEEESAAKYKQVLDIIDDFDELDTDDLYAVLNSVIEGAGNNETIYRDDNGVESDVGRIDNEGNVEIIGTDLDFPREMAEKILLYIDEAGLAPLKKAKTITKPNVSNIVEPKSKPVESIKEPEISNEVKEPSIDNEGLFDKIESEEDIDKALNQFESKVKEPEPEFDDEEEDDEEDDESEFGRLKGLTTEEELIPGNPVGEYEGVKAVVNPEILQSLIDSNNRMIKNSGKDDDLLFDDDTGAVIVLYKGRTTYPTLMASSTALQNYLGKYVDIVADGSAANELYEKYTLEGKKVAVFMWDKDILDNVMSFSKSEKPVSMESSEGFPEEVKEKKTRKPRTKKQPTATAAIDHTRFFNKIKKAAKLNDPYLMAHMMVTYSQAMEDIDTDMSIKLLEKAKEIIDA
jgi:hypothetical protein